MIRSIRTAEKLSHDPIAFFATELTQFSIVTEL